MTAPLMVDLAGWPAAVLSVDAAGVILTSNGRIERLVGDTVVGRRVADLVDTESSGRKWERMAALAPGDVEAKWELVLRGPRGLLEPRTFTVVRGTGDHAGLSLVEHPVDRRLDDLNERVNEMNAELSTTQRALYKEQRRLAHTLDELRQTNAALDEFAHAVSHDLKAPLRAIHDYSELLGDEAGTQLNEEHRGYLARLAVLSARMRTMIDAVLEYARAGRVRSPATMHDSGEVMREIVEFLAPPPDVTIVVSGSLPRFAFERVPFEQVFRNLISNAIKYRRSGDARVEVTAFDAGESWEFVVADNGPGIAASQHQRIWNLFETGRPMDGTGIGLALVKRIVEAQGGSAFVKSEVGAGAQFHVRWAKQPQGPEREAR